MTKDLNVVLIKFETLTNVFLVKFVTNMDNNLNVLFKNSSLTNVFLEFQNKYASPFKN